MFVKNLKWTSEGWLPMKFVIQCTTQASVTIDQKLYSEIGKGFLVLIGICDEDTKETAEQNGSQADRNADFFGWKWKNEPRVKRCRRTASFGFPIYPVRGLQKRQPAVLCQSRIATTCKRALRIHHRRCKKEVPVVKTGVFGAEMEVALINDGPFTIILDSKRPGVSI